MLSRSKSTLLGKKLFQAYVTLTSKQFPWSYVVPLPFDATTLTPGSQPFIISPIKQLSVFETRNIFKNIDKIFWLVDPHKKNYNYLGDIHDTLSEIATSPYLSTSGYEKLMLISKGEYTIEDFNKSLDPERRSIDEFFRIEADIKLAIANDLIGKTEGLSILSRLSPGYHYDSCVADILGVKYMLKIRFEKKYMSSVSQCSELYEIFMLFLAACHNDYWRKHEYCLMRNKEGYEEEPWAHGLHRMFASLVLHPLVKNPAFMLECDFSYPIKYISEWMKYNITNEIDMKVNGDLKNSNDLMLIFAQFNKAGYYYEQGRVEEMTECFNHAMEKLQRHCYREMYPKAFLRLQEQLSINANLVAPTTSFSYRR